MRRCIITILIFLPYLLLSQQEDEIVEKYNSYKYNHPVEYAYLTTDKKVYYNGGYIKFNLAVLNQYLSATSLSEIAYLLLMHENGEFELRYPFRLNNGVLSGGFQLPMDLQSGNYQLVAYTHFMENFNLDKVTMRQSIYIQNTSGDPGDVVKTIRWNNTEGEPQSGAMDINVSETKSRVLFEINSDNSSIKECFIVSEGFGLIQFVGKIKLTNKKTGFSINKSQLKGSFQKVILLDEQLNVLGARGYYLKYPSEEVNNGSQEGIGQRISASPVLEQDSISLFRRVYQLYYNIPRHVDLSSLSFNEMTSSMFLKENAGYVFSDWNEILASNSNRAFSYKPEKNLHIRRKIDGDLKKLEEGYMTIHFFNHDLDLLKEIDTKDTIDLEIGWQIGDDQFLLSLFNSDGENISDRFQVRPLDKPKLTYQNEVSFYDRQLSDSLILKEREFNYVLSTFSEEKKAKKYFWEEAQFNQIAKVEDYRGLSDFEEFIREAVLEVTVTREEGERSLAVYNAITGSFEFPQMLILNDKVLNNAAPLFDIPYDQLISVNAISSKENLAELGLVMAGGIIVVLTKKPIDVPQEYLNNYFGSINGFLDDYHESEVSKQFNSTLLYEISINPIKGEEMLNDSNSSNTILEEKVLESGLYLWNRSRN